MGGLTNFVALCVIVAVWQPDSSYGTGSPPAVNSLYGRFTPPELDPKRTQGFWVVPRTTKDAQADNWAQVGNQRSDHTTIWAWKGDHTVGLLFDGKGSVAGVQVSVEVAQIKANYTPFKFDASNEWFRQKFLGVDVYSTIFYVASKQVLAAGGRVMTASTPTVQSLELLRVKPGGSGTETSRLVVANTETAMMAKGWTKQGCYPGQGYHLYEGLTEKTSCDDLRTYFPVTSPTAQTITALGVTVWGKVTDKRPWFESQKSIYLKGVLLHVPQCLWTQIDTYGLNSIHFFFNDQPWTVPC